MKALNKGVRRGRTGILNRDKLDAAGLKKEPGDYVLIAGAVTFVAVVLGLLARRALLPLF